MNKKLLGQAVAYGILAGAFATTGAPAHAKKVKASQKDCCKTADGKDKCKGQGCKEMQKGQADSCGGKDGCGATMTGQQGDANKASV